MEISLFEYANGPCPYLPEGEWITHSFFANELDGAIYESLISRGFRRSGLSFYRNNCPGCNSCRPMRVDVEAFKPTRSQRRVLKKNSEVIIRREPAAYDEETYRLYSRYSLFKHESKEPPTELDYQAFLIESPVDTEIMRYYLDERLVGAGWIDVLPDSLSSVYFAFEPDFARLSLGVFSLLKEIELCRELGKKWLQLGFWVEGSPKMDYKSGYKPHQLLIDEEWRDSSF